MSWRRASALLPVMGSGPDKSDLAACDDAVCHDRSSRQAVLRKLYVVWTLHMCAWMLLADSKMLVYLRHFKEDSALAARASSRSMVSMTASGLVLAPLLASASDAYGRQFLLLSSPLWSLLLRAAELAHPSAGVLLATSSLSAVINAGPQGVMTCIADIFPSDAKSAGGWLTLLQTGTFAGAVLGPLVSTSLAERDVRLPLLLSALLSAVQAALVRYGIPETLSEKQRIPFDGKISGKGANPFSMFRLFTCGPRLASLSIAQFLAHLAEPILVSRVGTLVYAETLGWDVSQRGRYSSLEAAASIPGCIFGGQVADRLGTPTAFALGMCAMLSEGLLGAFWVRTSWQQFAVVPLAMFRGLGSAALNTLVLHAGSAANVRQAELRGHLQGLQALASLLAYPLWTAWFSRCVRADRPRRFFLGVAAAAAVQLMAGVVVPALTGSAEEDEMSPMSPTNVPRVSSTSYLMPRAESIVASSEAVEDFRRLSKEAAQPERS